MILNMILILRISSPW